MAMHDFLRSVQTARNVALFNRVVEWGRNGQTPPPFLGGLRRALGVWLSPRVVGGYDPEEFTFLPSERQRALTAAVSGYREIAEAVTGREPTDEEVQRAADRLFEIGAALGDEALAPEGRALIEAVKAEAVREPFPEFVLGLDYSLDTDWAGEPAIWIWVIVPDELDPESEEFGRFVTRFPRVVQAALNRAKYDRQPYIRYRLLSEASGAVREEVA